MLELINIKEDLLLSLLHMDKPNTKEVWIEMLNQLLSNIVKNHSWLLKSQVFIKNGQLFLTLLHLLDYCLKTKRLFHNQLLNIIQLLLFNWNQRWSLIKWVKLPRISENIYKIMHYFNYKQQIQIEFLNGSLQRTLCSKINKILIIQI